MTRYLDPTNEFAFKKLFSNKERLIGFLNSILRLPEGHKIIDLDYIPTQQMPIFPDGKDVMFDIKVTDQSGKWYIVEMQRATREGYLNRVQFYGSYTYISQLDQGALYKNLLPVIVVSVIGDKVMPDELPCINYHTLKETTTNKQYLFSTTYVFVELGKFKNEIKEIADEWMHLLKCAAKELEPYEEIHDRIVLSAYDALEQFRWSRDEHDAYVRASLTKDNEEAGYEEKYNKGMAEGMAKGKAEGELKGIEIGIEKTALNMLQAGFDLKVIASVTGLSEDQIQKLKNSL